MSVYHCTTRVDLRYAEDNEALARAERAVTRPALRAVAANGEVTIHWFAVVPRESLLEWLPGEPLPRLAYQVGVRAVVRNP